MSSNIPVESYRTTLSDTLRLSGRALRYAMVMGWDRIMSPSAQKVHDIPWHFDAVTPQWMEAVLCRDVPGAKVESVEQGIGHVGTTGRQQYLISYNETGRSAGLPEAVFTKGTPTFFTRLAMSVAPSFELEGCFYRDIRPLVEMEAPVGYHSASCMMTGRSIHVLEDLVDTKGATFPQPDDALTEDQAHSMVANLAAYHGRFYGAEELDGALSHVPHWSQLARKLKRQSNIEKYHYKGLEKAHHFLPEALLERPKDSWLAALAAQEDHSKKTPTIIHCDTHLRNWYLTSDNQMGLLDWQLTSKGYYMRDVTYTISTSLTVEQRREWLEPLIKTYLSELYQRGGPKLDVNDVWDDFRRQLFCALAFWTPTYAPPAITPDDMQPEEVSVEMLTRFVAAIVDLDCFDAFPELG